MGDSKAVNEREIIAQDQALQGGGDEPKILKTLTDTKRRLCEQYYEATDHAIPAYTIFAQEQYNSDIC